MGVLTDKPSGRDQQLCKLEAMYATPGSPRLPELVYLFGLAATGKTKTIRYFLASSGIHYATAHTVELYNPRLVLESLFQQLAGFNKKCENLSEFINSLKQHLNPSEAYVILLEQSERLRDSDHHLKQVFCRLQEYTGLNISCILESRLDWAKFRPNRDVPNPILIHFPQYTKDELCSLLVSRLPGDRPEEFKADYANLVLSVFFVVARSIVELSHIANLHYTDYCKPVETGECSESDTKKLWFNIESQLRKCISTVHLREIASSQFLELQHASKEDENLEDAGRRPDDRQPVARSLNLESSGSAVNTPTVTSGAKGGPQPMSGRQTVELPFYSKFLVIAAYLASYNPQKSDKRFFLKNHGKQRKTTQSIKAKERSNTQLTGPKPFPLERMLAIFYNIVEEKVNPTANIYSQITSLVRLQLISAVGQDQLDQPKYKSNVNLDFVRNIGRTLKFDVHKYLYDQC